MDFRCKRGAGVSISIANVLLFLIENGPGRTESELAEAIFGREGYQQRVNGEWRTAMASRHCMRQ